MSLALTFPGIYVQELPLSSHSIRSAPTSIAVFVGYTHPVQTKQFGTAIRLFSFTEYEDNFGGLYTSGLFDSHVARAVFQFFLNGGSTAWVVGLNPDPPLEKLPFSTTIGSIEIKALEPCDIVPMTLTIANRRQSTTGGAFDTFDLVIAYGSRNETYRGLTVVVDPAAPNKALDKIINGVSKLIEVVPATGYGSDAPTAGSTTIGAPLPSTVPNTTFAAEHFTDVFADNSSLDKVEIFNLLLIPGVSDNLVVSTALSFAERKRAFVILDPPENAVAHAVPNTDQVPITAYIDGFPKSQNGALYFPYLLSTDPVTNRTIAIAPSGFVAGIFARTDANRGVWKAPAGFETTVLNTPGPVSSGLMNDPLQGTLNQVAINCLRTFNAIGTVVFGARTLVGADANTSFPQSRYVPVRRMTLFIEQTLVANLKWVVFEPNDEPLWVAIRTSIEAFMLSLFNQGALQGAKPSDAFRVKCDATTTTSADQDNGIVNIIVAFAPLKPAEFVVIKIAQLAGQSAGA